MLAVTVLMAVAVFFFKDWLFRLVLWPLHSDFPTYRLLSGNPPSLSLINTALTEQFMAHMKVSLVVGLLAASPYLIYSVFKFISPALYEGERKITVRLVSAAYAVFIIGLAVNYILIFPLTVRFLGTYSVSDEIEPMLTLSNYIDTLLIMSFAFGLVFELPVISWLLGRVGLLKAEWMSQFRRHAFVAILAVAAVITPTTDIFTLVIVSVPIWLLYEISIFLVPKSSAENRD
ncbi:MAG: twin-arginine translocase subunit TatC [Bacteroidaceae bacterium]|nr:twin-arginine translocase subunit TatC [Bacteroidaceae bacterium]